MIIKIEGLPEGQKIKHINVDISFEDDGPVVKTSTVPSVKSDTKEDSNIEFEKPVHPGSSVQSPDVYQFDGRPQKEVPPEMQDLEF